MQSARKHEKFIVFVAVTLAFLGIRAYVVMPQSIFPAMSFSRVDVVADAGDLPPDKVRVAIARPLERALQDLPSVTTVTATSTQGSAECFVTFEPSVDPQAALASVNQALAQVRADIPQAANVVAAALSPSREPVLSYALTSPDLSQAALRQLATTDLVPRLYGTPGLGQLLVNGGARPEYHVTLEPAQLAAAGLGAAEVERSIAAANDIRDSGIVQRGYQNYSLLLDGAPDDRSSLEQLAIPTNDGGSVPLSSLAAVSLGVAPATEQTSLGGHPAVVLEAYALPGADTVAMASAFRARIEAATRTLPSDVAVSNFWDQTTLVRESQRALRDAILLGALLAIAVIYAFLRNLRLTLVAAAVIPLAIAITLFTLALAGQTLNLMSVGGLAVAVGLIIDDAIVVLENIARNRRERPRLPIDDAISLSMGQLGGAMTASTAATVVVFLPLAFLGGVTGYFFRALAFTLSTSLVISLALASFVAPALARRFLPVERHAPVRRSDSLARVIDRYENVLHVALANRTAIAAASFVVLLCTAALLSWLPSDFLPEMDEGQFEIGYTLPVGTTLAASDDAARLLERVAGSDPAVASVAALTGVDSNGLSPTPANQGALRVRLVSRHRREGYEAVSDRLRDRLSQAAPSALFDFRQILEDLVNDLSGAAAPIEVTITGGDQRTLVDLASRVTRAITSVPGVVDAASGVSYDAPSVRIVPRGAALAALGITQSDAGDAIVARNRGTVATAIAGDGSVLPVRVSIADATSGGIFDPASSLYVRGTAATLGEIATSSTRRLSTDIVTVNGETIARVTANVAGANLSSVTAGIRNALHSVAFPPGYAATIGGEAQTQATSFAQFSQAIALAVMLVFAVMIATFRSFRVPIVVLTAVPLALIGVAIALVVTRTALNVSSFMGMLLLVGVVVKNGILLVDAANRRRAEGAGVEAALVLAGRTRLRPILMTTLAAIGGLFPLALGLGEGAEMERPLAIAVIGGLSTATLFTLIVIPVVYATLFGRSWPRARFGAVTSVVAIATFASCLSAARAQDVNGALTFSALTPNDAEHLALEHSPDVAVARSRVEENRAALAAARSGLAPSLVSSYEQTPQGNPPGPYVISRQVSAELQWNLADLIGFAPAVRAKALALDASVADERAAEIAERLRATTLYFDALKARAVASAARSALSLANQEREATQLRYEAGDAPQLDVTRAGVAVARAEAALELETASDQNATDALAVEAGIDSGRLDETRHASPDASVTIEDAGMAVKLARALRPEILSAERTIEAARAMLDGAKAATLPVVTFGGGYLFGTDSGVPVNAPAVSANLSFPLGGASHDEVRIAAETLNDAAQRALGIGRQIELDVAASTRMLGASERSAAATARARTAAELELHATEIGYRAGASSSLELTEARTTFAQAEVDELSATYDLEKARVQQDIELGR